MAIGYFETHAGRYSQTTLLLWQRPHEGRRPSHRCFTSVRMYVKNLGAYDSESYFNVLRHAVQAVVMRLDPDAAWYHD